MNPNQSSAQVYINILQRTNQQLENLREEVKSDIAKASPLDQTMADELTLLFYDIERTTRQIQDRINQLSFSYYVVPIKEQE